ncbi:MAG: DNA mismatch repair endonuclease MutL [Candidatus Eisenbacteria bacterium]|nr:DNA mismatch repair endonuclease MutL [Candidatus Eisenbacteria bacterium]
MASRIRILSEDVQNRIAAGEVVEAPHSVVKELLENALDAGADEIAVDIKGGGSDLVRVVDNGSGMNADDAVNAFDRFATSKLRSESDLTGVSTLGFRGEALPSIASVSRMRLLTCEEGSAEGTEVTLVGGEIRDVRPAGRAAGTTVEVSSLFFNTPARRKFLRSDRVETKRIMDLLTEYAVLRPDVRFDVSVNGKLVMGLLKTDRLRERVAGVMGAGLARDLVPVSHESGPYAVSGLTGKPSIARQRGAVQVLAVNGRPVRSRLVSAAVRSGYGELLPRKRHPVLFLFLEVDGRLVDVNVHPTKREVRFGSSQQAFGAVEEAVRNALMSLDTAPSLSMATGGPESQTYGSGRGAGPPSGEQLELAGRLREKESGPASGRGSGRTPGGAGAALDERVPARVGSDPVAAPGEPIASKPRVAADEAMSPPDEGGRAVKFWQLHNMYVFVQTREGVLVIDQHAAHERILYEKARGRLLGTADSGPSQQLLFPAAVELSPADRETFDEIRPLLERLGFSAREMSGNTVLLEAVPAAFTRWPTEEVLRDILGDLPSGRRSLHDLAESIATTYACKAAIKAGDRLREEEMRSLVDQLFATELPYSCPHGRPTFLRMTSAELDKRFGRT